MQPASKHQQATSQSTRDPPASFNSVPTNQSINAQLYAAVDPRQYQAIHRQDEIIVKPTQSKTTALGKHRKSNSLGYKVMMHAQNNSQREPPPEESGSFIDGGMQALFKTFNDKRTSNNIGDGLVQL